MGELVDDGRAVSEEVLGALPQARRYTAPLQLDPADPLAVVVDLGEAADQPLPPRTDGHSAAVLLVDTRTDQVVGVDDLARDLAPGVDLPVSVSEWFREAGLQDVASARTGDAFSVTEIPLHGDARTAADALLVLTPSPHPLTRAAEAGTDGGDGRVGRLLLTLSEALTATTTVRQIAATITDVVAAELGAAGGGLLLADATCTGLDFVTLGDMPSGTDTAWAHIDWNSDAPLAAAARTRRSSFYSDSAAMLAAHPSLLAQAELPVMGASASLPLVAGDTVLGAVFLYWDQPHVVLDQQQEVLSALARYCAQAVQRATLIAERRTTAEVLQHSLMTRLPEPDHLELRARYVAAAAEEHVGGDWYDAVTLPDGGTTVIIGDVTGHDMVAAAEMGQLRGLLRAFAFDRQEPPADIVSRLDRAVAGLHVNTLATLVLARIEQTEDDERSGWRRVRWTNAGHPPPILLHADGTTEVLATPPEVLVGLLELAPGAERSDHVHGLPPGSTLLLFTDGLVEHRGRSIDDGYDDLRRVLTASADRPVQELLDHVVAELVGEFPDDDCAILAVRAHPQGPAATGRGRTQHPRPQGEPVTVRSSSMSWRQTSSRAWSASAPEVATPRVMALTTGWLWIAGGSTVLLVARTEESGALGPLLSLTSVGAFAVVLGLVVLRLGRRLPKASFHPIVAAGTLLITLATLSTSTSTGAVVTASLFTFIAIDAAFYFALPQALAHVALAVVGISVSLGDSDVPPLQITALFLVCLAVGGVTAMLVARAAHADRDTLTGLPNRRRFDEAYASAVRRHSTDQTTLTLGLLDLDDLAVVNQVRGHDSGDDVLRRLASTVLDTLRAHAPTATVARFGGDEFVLLLPGMCVAEAAVLVARVRQTLTSEFSCGLAQLVPGEDRGTLLRRADAALFQAKAENRGGTCLADDGEALLAADLQHALRVDPDQVSLAHQPIVDLRTQRVVAVEALCRWTHPVRGFVSPADFIPAAETAGIINELGLLVLRQACTDAIRLRQVQPELVVTVNVSGRQLVGPGFHEDVLDVLALTGLPPEALCLEVTESVVDGSSPAALAILHAFHAEGLRIAIDDFGTGYSAFSRLDALPAHHLKVDAAFTAGITTSTRRAGILQGLLGICEALDLSVVAEGVETPAQAEKLVDLGCPLAQGYLFARPAPVERLLEHLAESARLPTTSS